jgi:hypothetical protein
MGVIIPSPTYPLPPIWLLPPDPAGTDDSSMQYASWRHPSIGPDIHASRPDAGLPTRGTMNPTA